MFFDGIFLLVLGSKVTDTIRKGIIDVEEYKNETQLLMVGNVAALTGKCLCKTVPVIWLHL